MIGDSHEISLGEFEQEFFESLDGSNEIVEPNFRTQSYYHTVFVDGERAGIVGLVPLENVPDSGFVQIVLGPAYRGKGLIEKVYEALIDWHGLKTLYATIRKGNVASITAHKKIGFSEISEEKTNFLRSKGLIDEDEIRLEKEVGVVR